MSEESKAARDGAPDSPGDVNERTSALPLVEPESTRTDPFRGFFEASPTPLLVLSPDAPSFTIIAVNDAYLAATMRSRDDLIGRALFDALPENPADSRANGVNNLRASLERVLAGRAPDSMPTQRYDVAGPDGIFQERWWDPVNTPVLSDSGLVEAIVHHVTDVTQQVRTGSALRNSESARKVSEDALRTESNRNAQILESISDAFYAVDSEWRFTYINRRTETWTGRSRESLLGKVCWDEFPEAVGSEPYLAHLRAAKTREVVKLEAISPLLGHWVDISIYPAADEGLSVYLRDMSEKRQAEERIRETSRRLEAILSNTREAVFLTDERQRCIYANAAAEKLTGYSSDELQHRTLHELIHHKGPDGHDCRIEQCSIKSAVHRRAQTSGEELFVHKDGSFYPVAFTASPVFDENGATVGTVFEARNIAEERARDAALRESEARVRALTDNLPAGMVFQIWTGRDGRERRFLYVSESHEKLTGVPASAVFADPTIPYELIVPEDRGALARAETEAVKTDRSFDVEVRFRRSDGEIRWCRIISAPREQDDGSVIWDGIQIDTTDQKAIEAQLRELTETLEQRVAERTLELKQAHDQLRHSQKLEAMGQLTGSVSHDFNNLLSPIIGSLDLLQRRSVGEEREQRLIDGALQSAERARVLVQRLLAFARRQPLQPKPVNIGALVSDMADLIGSTSGPQIKVVLDVEDDVPAAVADPNQIEMAVLNLSVNARDAMPDGGTLRITVGAEQVAAEHRSNLSPGRYVRVSVADTGVGMDEPTLHSAVEPFFSTKGIGRGTGLGLSMVHGLAAQLGGALTIDSRPGLGTNVQIWLPASDDPEPARRRLHTSEIGRAQGTVLLVDDEELVRCSTADMLLDLGYAVVEASSADEALRLIREGLAFDVLVTDHLMPGMTGSELAREVTAPPSRMRVLVISGYADVDGIAPEFSRLAKPFRQADLAAKLLGMEQPSIG